MAQALREELPHVPGQGRRPRVPGCDGTGAVERSYPTPEARGGCWEEQPHVQGAVAVWVQEGLEELLLAQGQGQRLRVPGCIGTGAAERSCPTSEVRAEAGRSYHMPEVRGCG